MINLQNVQQYRDAVEAVFRLKRFLANTLSPDDLVFANVGLKRAEEGLRAVSATPASWPATDYAAILEADATFLEGYQQPGGEENWAMGGGMSSNAMKNIIKDMRAAAEHIKHENQK